MGGVSAMLQQPPTFNYKLNVCKIFYQKLARYKYEFVQVSPITREPFRKLSFPFFCCVSCSQNRKRSVLASPNHWYTMVRDKKSKMEDNVSVKLP